ncbi:MAG: preprotein translocase subunit SecG [Sphingomonas sp. 28-66-16]|nr:MAG: preprotein translocase subunit SecG [Sphingomonas sp. 28-66-16]
MFTFLLVVHAIIAAALVGVILMQRSEGGGLGMGGSPSGLMSARGAADFLTRATSVLASLFVGLSILLAFLAAMRHSQSIDPALARQAPAPTAIPGAAPAAPAPLAGAPQSAAAVAAAADAQGNVAAPAGNSSVPLER